MVCGTAPVLLVPILFTVILLIQFHPTICSQFCPKCVCGISNRHMRVVGGNLTKVDEFPWMAGLGRSGDWHCGATLITHKHILTAAHCVNGFDQRQLLVVLADHNRKSPDRTTNIVVRGIRMIHEHRDFDVYSFDNDIAIVELDESVEFSSSVQPACLPSLNSINEDYAGRLGVVTGWGRLGENAKRANILRKVTVPIWSRQQCYASDYGAKKISKNMFCAGYLEGGQDACQGDSGGPIHMMTSKGTFEVVGVVSWGRGCGRPNLPGVYIRISNYLQWIYRIIGGENCLCQPTTSNGLRKFNVW